MRGLLTFPICVRYLLPFPPLTHVPHLLQPLTFPLVSLSNWLARTRLARFCYCGEFVV